MARALNKKYFGNRNIGSISTTADNGIGGKSIAGFSLGTAGTHYSLGLTATISAPDIVEGVRATVTVGVNSTTGAITGYTIVETGSGYITTPTVTLVPAPTKTYLISTATTSSVTVPSTDGIFIGMLVSGSWTGGGTIGSSAYVTAINTTTKVVTVTTGKVTVGTIDSSSNVTFTDTGSGGVAGTVSYVVDNGIVGTVGSEEPAIYCSAFLPTASQARNYCDIIKQVSGRRYKVQNADGNGICQLTAGSSLAAGQMSIIATDSSGNTYFVTKLTNHLVLLTQYTQNGSNAWEFSTGQSVRWTFSSATKNMTVNINNA